MEQKFFELETKWMNAWKNKDEATARQIMADEFTLTSSLSTGYLVNKEGWLEKAMHHFECTDFKIESMQVRVYDNTAVLNIWLHQNGSANGKDWSGDFLLTDVWVQKHGDWKVVTRHSTWLQKK